MPRKGIEHNYYVVFLGTRQTRPVRSKKQAISFAKKFPGA